MICTFACVRVFLTTKGDGKRSRCAALSDIRAGSRRHRYFSRGCRRSNIEATTAPASVWSRRDGRLRLDKKSGKLVNLIASLNGVSPEGTTGIGHTRWATHGGPTDSNAHPHTGCGGEVVAVHNGIVENYRELRERPGVWQGTSFCRRPTRSAYPT